MVQKTSRTEKEKIDMKEIIPVKQHIDQITKENGSHLNFTLDYKVEVKVRDGKPVSIIWRKE